MFVEFEITESEYFALKTFYDNITSVGIKTDINDVIGKIIGNCCNKEKIERNKKIYEMHETGATYSVIAKEFGLSVERVRQIYLKESRKREYQQQVRESLRPEDAFYDILLEVAKERDRDQSTATRAYNVLARCGILYKIISGERSFQDYSDRELLKLYGFGIVQLEISREASKRYEKSLQKEMEQNEIHERSEEVLDGC